MKRLIILPLLLLTLSLWATTYYISPTGNDGTGNGSITTPWFTLDHAWDAVSAGDTIFVRGGNYAYTASNNVSNTSGTAENLIVVINYPGEAPIFNYIAGSPYLTQRIGIALTNVAYVKIKGIRITNIPQPTAGDIYNYGMILWTGVTNSTFELIEIDHIGGWGVVIGDNCSDILFLNCDSHHNANNVDDGAIWGQADGFETGSASSTNITFRGCRAWWNSDDGWDLRLANGVFTLENCWSFWNGYVPGTFTHAGNGEGFKLGPKRTENTTSVLRTLTNCIAAENYAIQFGCLTAGYYTFHTILSNCTAYKSETQRGFQFDAAMVSDAHNCLDYDNAYAASMPGDTGDHNTWNGGVIVTNADFESLSTPTLAGKRQADGSLPKLRAFRLKEGSDLIDAGIDVGLTTDTYGHRVPQGSAPDIGATEYGNYVLFYNGKQL